MDDVLETEKMANLVVRDFGETGRQELFQYADKLKSAALMVTSR